MGCCGNSIPREETSARALEFHNKKREEHGSPDLILNVYLSKLAQDFAESLSKKKVTNFPIYEGVFLGENRYIYKGNMFDVEDMCNAWYNEINLYNQNANEYEKNTSHFTQMIWKNTTDVGFGFKKKGNFCYAVAFYYPPGNTLGEYKENVLFKNKNNIA